MAARTKTVSRRRPTRRIPPLNLTARVERPEKAVLFPTPAAAGAKGQRF